MLYREGKYDEAWKARRESVQIARLLHKSGPNHYSGNLVVYLFSYAQSRRASHKDEDTSSIIAEAVTLARALRQRDPYAYRCVLPKLPETIAGMLSDAGYIEEAEVLRAEPAAITE